MSRFPDLVPTLLSRCDFPADGTAVTCAVSGGADSLALLVLAVAAGCRVTAVHVDHGLRPGSPSEADVVAAAAHRFGAEFESARVTVTDGPNLESRARSARYQMLPAGVLTGHTADDQAETMLLNLLRGAGLSGLAGIRRDGRRPLLDLRRAETHALCAALDLVPVQDPSNDEARFRRNRVRAELLPLASAIAERDVVPIFARQARLLAEEADLLDGQAAHIDATDAAALALAPAPLARRAVRLWLRETGDEERHPPDAATVERVLAVSRKEVQAADIGRGWRVRRRSGRLTLERS